MPTTKNPAEIAKAPADHGFEWYADPIAKGGMELRKDAPRIRVLNLEKFVESFGAALVLNHINGTSLDVAIESVIREAIFKNRTVSNDTLREQIVSRVLLKDRTRTTVVREVVVEKMVFTAMDGTTHGTEIEAKQANLAYMIDNGMDIATARKMLKIDE